MICINEVNSIDCLLLHYVCPFLFFWQKCEPSDENNVNILKLQSVRSSCSAVRSFVRVNRNVPLLTPTINPLHKSQIFIWCSSSSYAVGKWLCYGKFNSFVMGSFRNLWLYNCTIIIITTISILCFSISLSSVSSALIHSCHYQSPLCSESMSRLWNTRCIICWQLHPVSKVFYLTKKFME